MLVKRNAAGADPDPNPGIVANLELVDVAANLHEASGDLVSGDDGIGFRLPVIAHLCTSLWQMPE